MDDTIETIFTKAGLSSNTQKVYRYAYAKLFDSGLFKRRISSTDNKKIIENINEISTNPNTVAMLLNICILIKRHYKKDDNVLVEYRNNQSRKNIIQHHAEKNVELQKELPKYQELTKYTEDLYKNKKYLPYIINFLLINYGVRNRDMDTIITYNKDSIIPEENHFYIRKNDVIFIRGRYKTVKKYGVKSITIRSRRFKNAVDEMRFIEGDFLLKNAKGGRISDEGAGLLIQSMTFKNIGESAYFKAMVKNANNDYDKLKTLSMNRGTNIETIQNHYRVDTI